MERLLVTTPIKKTWGNSEPILFLGAWCNDKGINISRDSLTCKPFAIKSKKKREDFEFIIKVEKNFVNQPKKD